MLPVIGLMTSRRLFRVTSVRLPIPNIPLMPGEGIAGHHDEMHLLSTLNRWTLSLCGGVLCAALAACAGGPPLDLPAGDGLAGSLATLRHEPGQPASGQPGMPLSLGDLALLVVRNNPDLRAARAQAGVAQAQLLEAGILPNPTVTGSFLPLLAGIGSTPAWNAGIGEDIRALLTLHARRRAAQAGADQVDAQILWQEWQLVGRAWLLAVQLVEGGRSRQILEQAVGFYTRRDAVSEAAVIQGNATLLSIAPDRGAMQQAMVQSRDLDQLLLQRHHALAALMGLVPDAAFSFSSLDGLPQIDTQAVEAMLPDLSVRRPDLVALQLGYRAENARLRGAILAQFPAMVFGATGGSDNSNVRNGGPQLTLDLPIFDRNQGNIAIARATRQQLHDEYAARLAAASGQLQAMLSEQTLQRRQVAALHQELHRATDDADAAGAALAAGNVDERSAIDLIATRLNKSLELVSIEQSVLEQQVAIVALIGFGFKPVSIPIRNG